MSLNEAVQDMSKTWYGQIALALLFGALLWMTIETWAWWATLVRELFG